MFSLDASVSNFAYFLAVELLPFLVVEVLIEGNDCLAIDKVDKSVTNIALVLEIDWQVKEIISSFVSFINSGKQHLLIVLVGDVSNHQSGSLVFSIADSVKIQAKLGLVFN